MLAINDQQNFNFKIGTCNLQVLLNNKNKAIVILTEIADNTGTSITNAFEKIATQVYHTLLPKISINDITWIEHYDKNSYHNTNNYEETFDQVILSWDREKEEFRNPRWQHLKNWSREVLIDEFLK